MGQCSCCLDDESVMNRRIDGELVSGLLAVSQIYKLLLLGSGSVGKSTVFKQLYEIYGQGVNEEDRLHAIPYIHSAIVQQMQNIIDICIEKFQYPISSQIQSSVDFITELNSDATITEKVANHIKLLWEDESIKKTFENRCNVSIADSCDHFFDSIDRIGKEDFIPTEKDMLLIRIPTSGIRETFFTIDKTSYELCDVGGQRNERNKWIHCFENVSAVLFVASLSCYDQTIYEDDQVNAMDESLHVFSDVIGSSYFTNTSIVLFLNKADLFKIKIKNKELTVWDKDYNGTPNSYDEGIEYIQSKFLMLNKKKKPIYNHITTAIDRDNIHKVFDTIHGIVIKSLSSNTLV